LVEITNAHKEYLQSLYGDDIFPPSNGADDEKVHRNDEGTGNPDEDPAEDMLGSAEEPAEHDYQGEEVQGSAPDTEEDNQAKEDDKAGETLGDDKESVDNGEELIGLVVDMATTQDDTMPEDIHDIEEHGAADELATETETESEGLEKNADKMAVCTAPTEDSNAAKEETQLGGHEKKADELAACTSPTVDTKAAEEVPLMSEVANARGEDDDNQSTLRRLAKMNNSKRQAV
jgi:hypothetical protein